MDKIDINRSANNRKTPLMAASKNSHLNIIEMLLALPGIDPNYANVNVIDERGRTPLYLVS